MTQFDEALERIKKATGARTQVDLANILNIRQSSISDAKKRNSIPADWYLKLYRTHGLNPDWLAEGVEPVYLKPSGHEQAGLAETPKAFGASQTKSHVVPVHGMAMSAQPPDQGSAAEPEIIGEIAIPEVFYRPSLLVIRMDGTSMEPLIRKGAFVGIDREQRRVLSGEIYAVQVPMEGLVLRRLFFDAQGSRFILRTENATHPDQTMPASERETGVIGRVAWLLQEL